MRIEGEELKDWLVKAQIDAFNNGYALGLQYGESVLGGSHE